MITVEITTPITPQELLVLNEEMSNEGSLLSNIEHKDGVLYIKFVENIDVVSTIDDLMSDWLFDPQVTKIVINK